VFTEPILFYGSHVLLNRETRSRIAVIKEDPFIFKIELNWKDLLLLLLKLDIFDKIDRRKRPNRVVHKNRSHAGQSSQKKPVILSEENSVSTENRAMDALLNVKNN